jgi:hypothetical protein
VWLLRVFLAGVWLVTGLAFAQQDTSAPADPAHLDFFSGIVEELPAGRVTVSRTALGKSESRSFLVKPETKVEGKLRTKARVTVRYRKSDEGDIAVQIIVRPATQNPPTPTPPKKG